MKYKGPILLVLIAICAAVLFLIPENKNYDKIASIGKPAPAFEYADPSGRTWKLADLKGNVVFLNFWATWCPTCKEEIPTKEAIIKKMEGRPFQMLGMLFRDDVSNLNRYNRQHNLRLTTLISPDNEAARLYGITGVPETFIIDKDGIVREKIVGARDWNAPENLALIEKWL